MIVMVEYWLILNVCFKNLTDSFEQSSDIAITMEPADQILPCCFNGMGFSDIDDYSNCYPGWFSSRSKGYILFGGKHNDDPYNEDIDRRYCFGNVNIRSYPQDGTDLNENQLVQSFDENLSIFITPTMKELSRWYDFKKMSHNDLWFCSDWIEE